MMKQQIKEHVPMYMGLRVSWNTGYTRNRKPEPSEQKQLEIKVNPHQIAE
jgi:hypothetical protein